MVFMLLLVDFNHGNWICLCFVNDSVFLCELLCCSQTGKRLMAKCRMLLQENEELGKNVSTGRVAKLEGDIALQKALITEMKKSEAGLNIYY